MPPSRYNWTCCIVINRVKYSGKTKDGRLQAKAISIERTCSLMSDLSENFIAGIAPGGLKEVYEVKILICYLLHSVETPLSSHNISEIFSEDEAVD